VRAVEAVGTLSGGVNAGAALVVLVWVSVALQRCRRPGRENAQALYAPEQLAIALIACARFDLAGDNQVGAAQSLR